MQLSQNARLASKSEVQDPEAHRHRKPSFLPRQLQGPIVTSIVRRCRVVEGGVNDGSEGESPVGGEELGGVND